MRPRTIHNQQMRHHFSVIDRLAVLILIASAPCRGETIADLKERMPKVSTEVHFFATGPFLAGRSPEDFASPAEVAEHALMVAELDAVKGDRAGLAELLKHEDPKVRTLALAALFQREDGRDLPLIATLATDAAPTFAKLEQTVGDAFVLGQKRSRTQLQPQSVGEVARAMLSLYLREAGFQEPYPGAPLGSFPIYWKQRQNREWCASWFVVKMSRAMHGISPIQPTRREAAQRVIAEIDRLPKIERAWTRLFVLNPRYHWASGLVEEIELVATAREIGREKLLRFLRREPVVNDPDLDGDRHMPAGFARTADFILRHARELLDAKDADTLLACEARERKAKRRESVIEPSWAIAAAELQPSSAGEILRGALVRVREGDERDSAVLASALWRLRGVREKDFLVDWFYAQKASPSSHPDNPGMFLRNASAQNRADRQKLLATLIAHPRFEFNDWQAVTGMLSLASLDRPEPLVAPSDIGDAERSPDRAVKLAEWRNLLRREFGAAESTTIALAKPQTILTRPTFLVPKAGGGQIAFSADGTLFATLLPTVEVREAGTGNLAWKLPKSPWPARLAFHPSEPRLFVLDRDRTLTEWDLVTREHVAPPKLTPKTRGGEAETHSFDRTISRLGVTGSATTGCYDLRTNKQLWEQHDFKNRGDCIAELSPDGALFAVARRSLMVRILDGTSGKLLREISDYEGSVTAMAFSPDGKTLVATTNGDTLNWWDVATGALRKRLAYPMQPQARMATTADGQWLAVASKFTRDREYTVGVFAFETGELRWEVRAKSENYASALALSPDGRVLLVSASGRIDAWHLE